MEEELYVFEVETNYKDGGFGSETICAKDENEMWEIYDENHEDETDLIKDSTIVDSWIQ